MQQQHAGCAPGATRALCGRYDRCTAHARTKCQVAGVRSSYRFSTTRNRLVMVSSDDSEALGLHPAWALQFNANLICIYTSTRTLVSSPSLGLPQFRALGTFGEVSRAEVRAPPAYNASSHHLALVVSEWRPPAARAMSVGLTSPFFFPHLFRTLWTRRCARPVVTPSTAPMSVPSPPRPNAPL